MKMRLGLLIFGISVSADAVIFAAADHPWYSAFLAGAFMAMGATMFCSGLEDLINRRND